jgi:membrane-associated phospholipid phosphatase
VILFMAVLITAAPGPGHCAAPESERLADPPSISEPRPSAPAAGRAAAPSPSIYRVSPLVDGAVIIGASLAIALPYGFSASLITPRCPCDPKEVNSFDRPSIGNASDAADVISNATAAMAIAGPALLDLLDLGFRPSFLEDMTVFAEALAVNGALVTLAKYITQRPLPRVYAQQAPDLINGPGGYRSFYSGHAATTFAALSVAAMSWNLRHGQSLWPWAIALVLGASVAVERVLAGYHFPTDVLVGAAMGTAVGITVPWLHRRGDGRAESLALLPRPDGIGLGMRF